MEMEDAGMLNGERRGGDERVYYHELATFYQSITNFLLQKTIRVEFSIKKVTIGGKVVMCTRTTALISKRLR